MAITEACKGILWLRNFFSELGYNIQTPTYLQRDNIASEEWASSEHIPKRAKNVNVRYFFVREHIQNI